MQPKYYQTDVEGLVKDPNSGAVLSVDNARLQAYKKQKAAFEEGQKANQRIAKVEQDLSEIKELLNQLLKRS